MKVKVTKCAGLRYWYWDKVGELFEVEDRPEPHGYVVIEPGVGKKWIEVDDAVVVADTTAKLPRQTVRNKYMREVKNGVWCDVYDILRAWEVTDPCLQHLLKKALAGGQRGHKDLGEDLRDILASAKRAVEMYEEWSTAE